VLYFSDTLALHRHRYRRSLWGVCGEAPVPVEHGRGRESGVGTRVPCCRFAIADFHTSHFACEFSLSFRFFLYHGTTY
jgi:hypothetical protein